jgi:hypothetical protein
MIADKTVITEREIWTTGRHGSTICLMVDEYDDGSIVASAEGDHVTDFQVERALQEEYPGKAFRLSRRHGYVYARSI